MFRRRLICLIVLLGALMLGLMARLVHLQLIRGDAYYQETLDALEQPPRWLPTIRGSILDRHGRVLASDKAGFDLCLHYHLTRLYDQRFWAMIEARYFSDAVDGVLDHEQAMALLEEEFFPRSSQSARRVLESIVRAEGVRLVDIRRVMHAKADPLIEDLAAITYHSVEEFLDAMDAMNDRLFRIRVSIARRRFYDRYARQRSLPPYQSLTGRAIEDDFAERVPDERERLGLIAEVRIREMTRPYPVLKGIDKDMALAIEEMVIGTFLGTVGMDRPVAIQVNTTRVYPYDTVACQLIGQLAPAAIDSLDDDPLSQPPGPSRRHAVQPGDEVGQWGAEYLFEPLLRGLRGWERESVTLKERVRIDPQPGQDIRLTLDAELQQAIQQLFERRGHVGAAVVIDVPSGEVLASVSVPVFNLNDFYEPETWRWVNLEHSWNDWSRDIGRNYETGSTIKPTVLLGGLEYGVVSRQSRFFCDRYRKTWQGPPHDIHNHGPISAMRAVKVSCNFYFVRLGQLLGEQRLVSWFRTAGFGRKNLAWPSVVQPPVVTPSSLSQPPSSSSSSAAAAAAVMAEQPGAAGMDSPAGPSDDPCAHWLASFKPAVLFSHPRVDRAFREVSGYLKPLGGSLSPLDCRIMSIGRGVFNASVLQMANGMATIARDGQWVAPRLVADPPVPIEPVRIGTREHVRVVQNGMRAVIYDRDDGSGEDPGAGTGTGYAAFHPLPWSPETVELFGKTGSTEYSVFSCYADAHDGRKLALAVLIEVDAHGSEVAAPIAREILVLCSRMGYLPSPRGDLPESSSEQ